MAVLVLNKCCFGVDLRRASLFYACLSLIIGVIALGASGIALKVMGKAFKHMDDNAREASGLRYNLLMIGINILLLFADLWATIDLMNGLYFEKRDKFRRYVYCSFLVYGLRLLMVSCVTIHLCNYYEDYTWLIISFTAVAMSIYLYFLIVIRSYYYKTEDPRFNMDAELNDTYSYDNIRS